MSKIKIDDLPTDETLDKSEMQQIRGGVTENWKNKGSAELSAVDLVGKGSPLASSQIKPTTDSAQQIKQKELAASDPNYADKTASSQYGGRSSDGTVKTRLR